jgi:2-polyprenyl-3-methyl-5-hydroxy-6-metoxy-1,4-benzoquinol methylase
MNQCTRHELLGFYEVSNKPTQQELNEYYHKKYYQESLSKAYSSSYSEQELAFTKAKLAQRFSAIADHRDVKDFSSFLDVGCGEGFGLSFFLEKGYGVKGLDFSQAGMEQHNSHCLPYLQVGDVFDSLNEEIASGKVYDVIWLQHVLEHVLDPIDLLNKLRLLVSEKGVLVVTIPNDFSALQLAALENKLIDKAFWIAIPDHISYFNTSNIHAVANDTNWKILDKLTDFPIDWFLLNDTSNYISQPNVGKSAHQARLMLELLIAQNDISAVNQFYRALAGIGMGRSITVILSR